MSKYPLSSAFSLINFFNLTSYLDSSAFSWDMFALH